MVMVIVMVVEKNLHQARPSSSARVSDAGKNFEAKKGFIGVITCIIIMIIMIIMVKGAHQNVDHIITP